MKLSDIIKGLKAEDAPIFTIPEQEKLQDYLRQQDSNDLTYQSISDETGITFERMLEIGNETSVFFRDVLAPKVLYKSMSNSVKDDSSEFEMFFQRPDVDLALLFMTKNKDVWSRMKMYGTPSFDFLINNWKKYRGY